MKKFSTGALKVAGGPVMKKFPFGIRFLGSVAGEMRPVRNSQSQRRKQVSAIAPIFRHGLTCTTLRKEERQQRCSGIRRRANATLSPAQNDCPEVTRSFVLSL